MRNHKLGGVHFSEREVRRLFIHAYTHLDILEKEIRAKVKPSEPLLNLGAPDIMALGDIQQLRAKIIEAYAGMKGGGK